ncbi:FapA family protein, partial [Patescibacteria group bacterium]|nr:FapA family protein [Patescibacteria group bacterium]
MKFRKIVNFSAVIVLTLVLFSSTAMAADFRVPSKSGNIDISQGEDLTNLYTAGNIVSINNNIKKDLVVAGNIITINGDIEDDLIAAGGTVIIKGNVGGTVRVAGGNLIIEGNIGEDLIIAGGNISVTRNSIIQGDLVVAGGNVSVDGNVLGDAKLGGGQITINNEIGGEVNAKVDKLILASQAKINGNLIYKSPKEVEMNDGAVVLGEVNFTQAETISRGHFGKGKILGILSAWFLLKMLMCLTAGLVLVFLLKNYT